MNGSHTLLPPALAVPQRLYPQQGSITRPGSESALGPWGFGMVFWGLGFIFLVVVDLAGGCFEGCCLLFWSCQKVDLDVLHHLNVRSYRAGMEVRFGHSQQRKSRLSPVVQGK